MGKSALPLQGQVAVVTGASRGIGRSIAMKLASEGADLVLTANAGCLLQVATEARLQGKGFAVMHPIDLLDMSYRGETIQP